VVNADVVVIGRGITGLSSAWHLAELFQRRGTERTPRIVLVGPSADSSASIRCAGAIAGGQFDNYSRVSHAHGSDFAVDFWRFGDRAFDAVVGWAKTHGVPCKTQRRVRLATSPAELKEMEIAVAGLSAAGFASRLVEVAEWLRHGGGPVGSRVVAVQDDGRRGGWIDPRILITELERGVQRMGSPVTLSYSIAIKVETGTDHVLVELADGSTIRSEIVVLGAHLAIGELVPDLKAALVSVADQWHACRMIEQAQPGNPWCIPGTFWSANNGYEWGLAKQGGRGILGGGRYLRKWAGIEATTAINELKIQEHLERNAAQLLSGVDCRVEPKSGAADLDCRPCDELPIIGPTSGTGRVIVATGYMGAGLTQGFLAGQCIAELIATGKSDALPRRLWPERLRTLES